MGSILKDNYVNSTYSGQKSSYPDKFCKYVFAEFPEKSTALDLGCGNGDFSLAMKKCGFDVHGADISNAASNILGNKLKTFNFEYKYPYEDNTFDLVFSKSVIEHLREPDFLFDEVYRILKPGGTFICMTPSWKHSYRFQFYIDHTHVTPFTLHSIEVISKMSGFNVVENKYFFQLPLTWKYPYLLPFYRLLSKINLPYRPFYKIGWPDTFNKALRFSTEAMLFIKLKK